MRRVAVGLAFVISLVGCGLIPGERVFLETGDPASPEWGPTRGCSLIWTEGLLLWNATDGTTITVSATAFGPRDSAGPTPLIWPPGYTARRAGLEVAVLDAAGNVVAITGTTYRFSGLFSAPLTTVCDANLPVF